MCIRDSNDVHGYPSLARSDREGTAQGTIYLFDIRSLQLINIISRKIPNFVVALIQKISDDVVLSLQEDSPSRTRLQLMDSETKVIKLKEEIGCMKEQIRKLKGDLIISQNEVATLKEHEEYWKHEISKLKDKAREAQATAEVYLKNRILSLEEELKKQRDRCITIIEEKEDEVQMLKSNMETTLEAAFRAAANTAARSVLAKGALQQTPVDFDDPNFMHADGTVEDTSTKWNRNESSPLSMTAKEFRDTELSDEQRESSIHGPGKTKSGFTGRDQVKV